MTEAAWDGRTDRRYGDTGCKRGPARWTHGSAPVPIGRILPAGCKNTDQKRAGRGRDGETSLVLRRPCRFAGASGALEALSAIRD